MWSSSKCFVTEDFMVELKMTARRDAERNRKQDFSVFLGK